MTVIACRGNEIAADTAVWDGDIKIGQAKKIIRLSDGSLLAACGLASLICAYYDWKRGIGEKPGESDKEDDFAAIHLTKDGVTFVDHRYREFSHPAKFYAEGSHAEFLYGAMAAGASAGEAVRLALEHGGFAGGGIQVERLE